MRQRKKDRENRTEIYCTSRVHREEDREKGQREGDWKKMTGR